MSLDVSPDGQTIVFDLLGDLYTMPIAGGTATRITKGMAFDAQPRFSPDGETIVFISDRSGGDNVWTLRMDFTDTTQVTRGNNSGYVSPEWMPNGEHILVSRSTSMFGAAKVVMYPADGGSPFPVVGGSPAFKSIGASPSPDGQHIWYAGRTGDWQYNAIFPQYQLYRFDREVGTSTQMTARYGSGFRPAISPDGNWLVYGTRENTQTGLRKRNLATGDEEWLVYAIQRDDMEARSTLDVIPGYSFTPDSRRIVISYGGKMWSVPMDGAAPSEIPFEADVDLAVGPEVRFAYQVDSSALVTARQIRHPVTSPDGSQLLFTAFDRVWIKDMPTGEATRVSDEEIGQYHAVWSPDGSAVAYVTWDDSAGGHIMRANADGSGQPQQLTSAAALYYNLAWSPDGERVVATRGAARELKKAPDVFFGPLGGEFVWVPANGGDVSLIAPTGSRNVAHFRTDQPNRIYAYSRAEGLVSFRWDGTDVKRHLVVRGTLAPGARSPHEEKWEQLPRHVFPVPVEPPSAGALEARQPPPAGLVMISPTGDRAVAQVGNHIYTVDLFQVGPAPLTVSVGGGAPVKVRKLTEIGGEFPSWSADGERVNWGIGNALFTYDLDQALIVRGILDSLKATRALIDSVKKADSTEVVADSMTTKLNGLIADSVQIGADSLMREAEKARARADAIRFRADSVRAGLDTVTVDSVGYKPDEMRDNDAGRHGQGHHRQRRRGDSRQPHRGRRGNGRGGGARQRRSHRRHRQDHHPRVRRHALPRPVVGARDPRGASVAIPDQPGVRGYHHARPPNQLHRSAELSGPGGDRRHARPPYLLHRPGCVLDRGHQGRRPRQKRPQAVQRVLRHQDAQDVHVGQPPAAAVDHWSRQGAGTDADHRGWARLQVGPDARHRWLLGDRTCPAGDAALPGRGGVVQGVPDDQQPDPARVIRRSVRGELLLHPRKRPR